MSPSPNGPNFPRRILIYGVTGSGKTTLARRLSERTGLPWHSVDDLTWEPNWIQVADEIQRERISAIVSQDEWILDTAYAKWIEVPLERVELVVGLDYPRFLSLTRLLRRAVTRANDKMPVCNGNIETWRNMVSRDSILLWHFKSFKRKQDRMRAWHRNGEPPTVLFRHPRQAESWLRSLPPGQGAKTPSL